MLDCYGLDNGSYRDQVNGKLPVRRPLPAVEFLIVLGTAFQADAVIDPHKLRRSAI